MALMVMSFVTQLEVVTEVVVALIVVVMVVVVVLARVVTIVVVVVVVIVVLEAPRTSRRRCNSGSDGVTNRCSFTVRKIAKVPFLKRVVNPRRQLRGSVEWVLSSDLGDLSRQQLSDMVYAGKMNLIYCNTIDTSVVILLW